MEISQNFVAFSEYMNFTPENTSRVLNNEILPENIIDPITKGTKKGPANPWRSVRVFLEDPNLLPNVVMALLMVLLNHLRFP